jgi:hypothetical protein
MKNSIAPEPSLNHTAPRPEPAGHARPLAAGLALLGLMVLAAGLSGCASGPIDQPQSAYNPVTGYPAVGDYSWRH